MHTYRTVRQLRLDTDTDDVHLPPAPSHFGVILLPQIGAARLIGAVGAFLASAPPLLNQLYGWTQDAGWLVFDDGAGWQPFAPP